MTNLIMNMVCMTLVQVLALNPFGVLILKLKFLNCLVVAFSFLKSDLVILHTSCSLCIASNNA